MEASFETFLINLKEVLNYTNSMMFGTPTIFVSDMKESYIKIDNVGMPELNGKAISDLKLFLNRMSVFIGQDDEVRIKEIDDNKVVFKSDKYEVAYAFSREDAIKNNKIIKIKNGVETVYDAETIYGGLVNALDKLDKVTVQISKETITSILKMVKLYRAINFYFVILKSKLYAMVEDVNKNYTKIEICDVDTVEEGKYKIQTLPNADDWTLSFFISTGNKFVEWNKEGMNIISILPKL